MKSNIDLELWSPQSRMIWKTFVFSVFPESQKLFVARYNIYAYAIFIMLDAFAPRWFLGETGIFHARTNNYNLSV